MDNQFLISFSSVIYMVQWKQEHEAWVFKCL